MGIAGETGAGKTTLLSLLTRFYDPTAGQILLDDVDVRDYKLADLRDQFAQEYSERLWKRLVVSPDEGEGGALLRREVMVALGFAAAAAASIKAPELFGMRINGSEGIDLWYARHLSLFVLPWLAIFFAWKRGLDRGGRVVLVL